MQAQRRLGHIASHPIHADGELARSGGVRRSKLKPEGGLQTLGMKRMTFERQALLGGSRVKT